MASDSSDAPSAVKKVKLGISVDIPQFRYHKLPASDLWNWLNAIPEAAAEPDHFAALVAPPADRDSAPTFTGNAEQIEKVISSSVKRSLLIVDVRTSDNDGGHITSAVNLPFVAFEQAVGTLVAHYAKVMADFPAEELAKADSEEVPAPGNHRLVFYCMYGKERGPACAQSFLTKFSQEHPGLRPPNVYVLSGGLTGWVNKFVEITESKASVKPTDASAKVAPLADFDSATWVLAKGNEDVGEMVVYRRDAVRWQQTTVPFNRIVSLEKPNA